MKKVLMILVCLCLLTVPVLAVEPSDFEYQTEFGTNVINWNRYYYALAQEKIANSGVALNVDDYVSGVDNTFTFDVDAFEADYVAALKAMQEPVESEVIENETTDTTVSSQPTNDFASDDKYPLGSYIDEMGRVYSPAGELLSSGTEVPSYLDAIGPILDEVLVDSDESLDRNEAVEPHVYSVVDLRSGVGAAVASNGSIARAPSTGTEACPYCEQIVRVQLCDYCRYELGHSCTRYICSNCGDVVVCECDSACDCSFTYCERLDPDTDMITLKSLIISIFGEYTPVMTTAIVTETVDNETTTTLFDVVAGGAAGVDYAWIAGVFLFGILLFCLMKLLGGILK